MKTTAILPLFIVLLFSFTGKAQTYYPLPEENAYWTVIEFDNYGEYSDVLYKVKGDTLINDISYKKVYRLDDYPTIYDTITTLHCFIRQNVDEKKVWFIRHYRGESKEKLGYDLSVEVGDTVSLPAFDYGNNGDSLFYLSYTDEMDLSGFEGNMTGLRKQYFYAPVKTNSNPPIGIIEGTTAYGSTVPNLLESWNAFYQTLTYCFNQDTTYMMIGTGYECGFLLVSNNEIILSNTIDVYPNPIKDYFTIDLPSSEQSNRCIKIHNSLGEVIFNKPVLNYETQIVINTCNWPNSLYLLNFYSSESLLSTIKIIKL